MTEYIFSETDREENILGFMAMQRGGEGGVFENLKGTALTIFNWLSVYRVTFRIHNGFLKIFV